MHGANLDQGELIIKGTGDIIWLKEKKKPESSEVRLYYITPFISMNMNKSHLTTLSPGPTPLSDQVPSN